MHHSNTTDKLADLVLHKGLIVLFREATVDAALGLCFLVFLASCSYL